MDYGTRCFVSGKICSARQLLEAMIDKYIIDSAFDKNLKEAVYALNRADSVLDDKVATPMAGADGINPSQLSDNGPAHQIAVLPMAGSPSDNTSQPESVKRECFTCIHRYGSEGQCGSCDEHYSNHSPA